MPVESYAVCRFIYFVDTQLDPVGHDRPTGQSVDRSHFRLTFAHEAQPRAGVQGARENRDRRSAEQADHQTFPQVSHH